MNKKIATEIAFGIIILLAVLIGGAVYLSGKQNTQAPASVQPVVQNTAKKQDALCGNLSQFKSESWASNFISQGGVFNDIYKGCKIGNIFLSNIGPSEFGCDAVMKYDIKMNKLTDTAIKAPDACASNFGDITDSYVEYFGEQGDGEIIRNYHGRYFFKEDRIESMNSESSLSDWQTYSNEKYGYEIKYPINWFIYDNVQENVFIQSSKEENGAIPSHSNAFEIKVSTTKESDLSKIIQDIGNKAGIKYSQSDVKVADMIFGIKAVSQCEGVGCGNPEWFVIRNGLVFHFNTNLGYTENKKIFNQILSTFKFIAPE